MGNNSGYTKKDIITILGQLANYFRTENSWRVLERTFIITKTFRQLLVCKFVVVTLQKGDSRRLSLVLGIEMYTRSNLLVSLEFWRTTSKAVCAGVQTTFATSTM